MPEGRFIETDEVESVAEEVRKAGDGMREAAAYAKEADPDAYMFGLVGSALGLAYVAAAPRIHAILGSLPEAFSGLADRIEASAAAVAEVDAETKDQFDRLLDEITIEG